MNLNACFLFAGVILAVNVLLCSKTDEALPVKPEDISTDTTVKVVFFGNSNLYHGIDFEVLSDSVGLPVKPRIQWGCTSEWQFASLWNEINGEQCPDYAIMLFNYDFITKAHLETDVEYMNQEIGDLDTLREIIDSIKEISATLPENASAPEKIRYSFLPLMIEKCNENNVKLIVVRQRQRSLVFDTTNDYCLNYDRAVAQYLYDNGMHFLDYKYASEIQLKDFADYDHYNPDGAAIFTRLFSEDLRLLLDGAAPKRSFRCSPCELEFTEVYPEQDTITIGDVVSASVNQENNIVWGALQLNDEKGESFIAYGQRIELKAPISCQNNDVIFLNAAGNGCKITKRFIVKVDSSVNKPPVLVVEKNVSGFAGTPIEIKTTISDDKLVFDSLVISWECDDTISGFSVQSVTDSASVVVFSKSGTYRLAVSVKDDASTVSDFVYVSVSENAATKILKPTGDDFWCIGDTAEIRWETTDIDVIVFSISYNNGKKWTRINKDVVQASSEKFRWFVSDTIPAGSSVILKIQDYVTNYSYRSDPFTIKNCSQDQ